MIDTDLTIHPILQEAVALHGAVSDLADEPGFIKDLVRHPGFVSGVQSDFDVENWRLMLIAPYEIRCVMSASRRLTVFVKARFSMDNEVGIVARQSGQESQAIFGDFECEYRHWHDGELLISSVTLEVL